MIWEKREERELTENGLRLESPHAGRKTVGERGRRWRRKQEKERRYSNKQTDERGGGGGVEGVGREREKKRKRNIR